MYSGIKLAVVGDFMLDQWLKAESIGICPGQAAIDFKNPSIILQKPGGAGNQAINAASLGATCTVYLAYGGKKHDSYSRDLEYFMRNKGIAIKEHIEPCFRCHAKRYFVHNNQLVFRTSDHHSIYGESIHGMAEDLAEHIKEYDGVIIADYNKGVCNKTTIKIIMDACHDNSIPVFVDPKFDNWDCYNGATIFKPNMSEYINNNKKVPICSYSVVTDGDNGLHISDWATRDETHNEDERHIPSRSDEVYDINGAGDSTMVAMVLEYLRTGGDILKAAHVGNIAGGICVGHKYTYQVTVEDLKKKGAWDE